MGAMSSSLASRPAISPVPLRTHEERGPVAVGLPRPLTSFVGRERETAACRARRLPRDAGRVAEWTSIGDMGDAIEHTDRVVLLPDTEPR